MVSIVPLSPLSGEVLTMVYTKGSIDAGIVEFDISTKKYKSVTAVERADKNYFIILIPKSTSISDSAIAQLESSKTLDFRLKFLCDLNLLRVVFIQQKIKDKEYLVIETTTLNEAIMHTIVTTTGDPNLAMLTS